MIKLDSPQDASLIPLYRQVNEASRYYGVSPWSMRDLVRQGRVRGKKFGKLLLIETQSADAHFDSLPDAKFSPLKRDMHP